jgi:hypothetical protein
MILSIIQKIQPMYKVTDERIEEAKETIQNAILSTLSDKGVRTGVLNLLCNVVDDVLDDFKLVENS